MRHHRALLTLFACALVGLGWAITAMPESDALSQWPNGDRNASKQIDRSEKPLKKEATFSNASISEEVSSDLPSIEAAPPHIEAQEPEANRVPNKPRAVHQQERKLLASIALQVHDARDLLAIVKDSNATGFFTVDSESRWYQLDYSSSDVAKRAQDSLRADPRVADATQQRALGFTSKTADPYFDAQWHLLNTSSNTGTIGNDANVLNAWNSGITGEGVLIAILDDGVEHTHPDLAANYVAQYSYDYIGRDSNPAPQGTGEDADNHGTAVAGLAAAVANNSLGGAGVAYDAHFAAYRILGASQSDSGTAASLYAASRPIDVSSNSWGPRDAYQDGNNFYGMYDGFDNATRLSAAALVNGVNKGRSGLGIVYTWAAGNGGFADNDSNMDGVANLPETIAVTAIDQRGRSPGYAEPGANILLGAPTGTNNIITTDRTGSLGYNSGQQSVDANYTDAFDGTSAATPIMAGVVALILQANPALTWRDVQHILVRTARQNSSFDSDWTQNGAGYFVNHKFGFGLVDADAAVAMARTWQNAGTRIVSKQTLQSVNAPIPDNNTSGINRTITVSDSLYLEHVQVVLDVQHSFWGDLDVRLTSPAGTESRLSSTGDVRNDGRMTWTFMSVRHWGEQSLGTWVLSVDDLAPGDSGTLYSWQLVLSGTETPTLAGGGTGALPTISSVSPSTDVARGQSVTITGSNLAGASVTIGGVAQTVTESSGALLTFVLNYSAPSGEQRVIVTNALGSDNDAISLQLAPASSKGGGGCAITDARSHTWWLALLSLMLVPMLGERKTRADSSK